MEKKHSANSYTPALNALKDYLDEELQLIEDNLSSEQAQKAMTQVISAVSSVLKMFTHPDNAVNLAFAHNKIYAVPNTFKTPEACNTWITQQYQEESRSSTISKPN